MRGPHSHLEALRLLALLLMVGEVLGVLNGCEPHRIRGLTRRRPAPRRRRGTSSICGRHVRAGCVCGVCMSPHGQDVARTRCIVSVCVVVIFGRRLACRGGSGDSGHSTNATRRRFSEVLEAAAPPPSTPPPLWGEEHAELTPQFRTALRGAGRQGGICLISYFVYAKCGDICGCCTVTGLDNST